ncbi:hypothetical protein BKN14_02530 [Candidatus Gracilibacteria bacterium HOT-871]|nr:hypothetical protein BKN14_02530 [Candidatus Gracilibacteria bacterium HOT-871]MBB1564839.1 DUF1971 domain-containing protein [Candidatus Gracilibacteria bacterium]RKW21208.1 MAG: DUF1971 domain-containing protein [Candidatus Gracilibacteria bacterium]
MEIQNIPENFYRYKQMPIWTEETIPEMVLTMHNTKVGVWGKASILEGALKYTAFKDPRGEVEYELVINAGEFGTSSPQKWHKVEPIGKLKMILEFFEEKPKAVQELEEEFKKAFPDKSPHYEVEYLSSIVENRESKKALDLGSGGGRNSLFLAKAGFDVTSWDQNLDGLAETESLARSENLKLTTKRVDLNETLVDQNYDVIISTVVLQFLEKESAKKLLKSATEKTNIGGYNLIIVPVDAEDMKCPIDFPNLMTYEEYLDFYKDWEIVHADDMVGQFHRTDENGHRIRARFATIIAKKIK